MPLSLFFMFRALCIFITSLMVSYPTSVLAIAVFDPGEHVLNAVTCPAIDRALNQTVNITIGEYTAPQGGLAHGVAYIDVNPSAGTTILMVHGWPSLWSSWGRQIEHFKAFRIFLHINGRPSSVCFRTIITW